MKIIVNNEKYKVIEFNKIKKEFICSNNKSYKINEIDEIEIGREEFKQLIKTSKNKEEKEVNENNENNDLIIKE